MWYINKKLKSLYKCIMPNTKTMQKLLKIMETKWNPKSKHQTKITKILK